MNTIRTMCAAALACASFAVAAQSEDSAVAATHWNFGIQLGTVQDHNNTEPAAQISLGYDFNRYVGVEALANVSLLFIRMGGLQDGDREFDSAVGARVLATLPLGERWNLKGGLGLVSFTDELGNGSGHDDTRHKTTPMASLSLMYRASRRWSFGAEVSSFTGEHTFNAGLRSEFHF
jgi:hypothetical protein